MPEIVENRRRELQQQLQQQQQSSSSSSSGTSIKHETKPSSHKLSNAAPAPPTGASHLSSGNDKDISPGRHSTNLSPQSSNATNIDRSHVDTSSTMTTPNGGANYGKAFVVQFRRTIFLSLSVVQVIRARHRPIHRTTILFIIHRHMPIRFTRRQQATILKCRMEARTPRTQTAPVPVTWQVRASHVFSLRVEAIRFS